MATGRPLAVVILAAGQGKRMKSGLVKVLHELGGRPMLAYPIDAAEALAPERLVVVVGRDSERVVEAFDGRATFVEQAERRGTGHAVLQARAALDGFAGDVLILYGDTPLLRLETLERMRAEKATRGLDLLVLSAMEPLPGRIVRDAQGRFQRIVEVTDASPEELRIQEGNTGTYLVDAEFLWKALDQVDSKNAQGEIYLTDIVAIAVRDGRPLDALPTDDADEALGINSRAELARAAAVLRRRTAQRVMDEGVTLIDPDATYLDWDVRIGRDTVIEPGCVIQGSTRIGERCRIKAHTVIESSELGDDVALGPSAHLRPGSRLEAGVRIGNFVEVKNSHLGAGVKADHLSYIGDADVGAGASFGCGSIVVNYDGVHKHRTTVEEQAFIGCNSNLIAPVTIEANAFVAAGSTITESVPKDALGVARGKQRNVAGWRLRTGKQKPGKHAKE
ncbi:MAG: UDP-N-acetylglucosamine diphosphorylase/glucosamine-1-phosphate N-acetyltransferase [Proteobacteria bacterium]|nr:MAG: UDP-N-acetylglucosamine diphosphorylase/glucosamine-1-phosphate N-acetyltransferase [Pseudomonadota bacterium]